MREFWCIRRFSCREVHPNLGDPPTPSKIFEKKPTDFIALPPDFGDFLHQMTLVWFSLSRVFFCFFFGGGATRKFVTGFPERSSKFFAQSISWATWSLALPPLTWISWRWSWREKRAKKWCRWKGCRKPSSLKGLRTAPFWKVGRCFFFLSGRTWRQQHNSWKGGWLVDVPSLLGC